MSYPYDASLYSSHEDYVYGPTGEIGSTGSTGPTGSTGYNGCTGPIPSFSDEDELDGLPDLIDTKDLDLMDIDDISIPSDEEDNSFIESDPSPKNNYEPIQTVDQWLIDFKRIKNKYTRSEIIKLAEFNKKRKRLISEIKDIMSTKGDINIQKKQCLIEEAKKLIRKINQFRELPEDVPKTPIKENKFIKKFTDWKNNNYKYKLNSLYYINWYSLEKDKIRDFDVYYGNYGFKFLTPTYEYPNKICSKLCFKTPWIKLNNDPLDKYFNRNNKYNGQMRLRTSSDYLAKEILPLCVKYDEYIGEYMIKKYVGYKQLKKIVQDNMLLTLFFGYNKRTKKIVSEIIKYDRYQTSLKHPSHEIFKNITLKDLSKFLVNGKEVRFILIPKTWMNTAEKSYGSKLHILKLEVKYENSSIISTLDNLEYNKRPIIKNIKI